MLKATVNTDASWCPNTKAGGWAAWISIDGGKRVKRHGIFHERAKSSTEAELWAILNGAWIAVTEYGVKLVLCQSDCKVALAQLRHRTLPSVELFMSGMPEDVEFQTKWVKGHHSDGSARAFVNEWCDQNAKRHMRRQRRKTPKILKGKTNG